MQIDATVEVPPVVGNKSAIAMVIFWTFLNSYVRAYFITSQKLP
jgi:hypothetical protein